jgi:hypothetical protein
VEDQDKTTLPADDAGEETDVEGHRRRRLAGIDEPGTESQDDKTEDLDRRRR